MIRIEKLSKTYGMGDTAVNALKNCSVQFETGKFIAITGTSGSGKSTLLHILGGLDTEATGDVFYDETNIIKMNDVTLSEFRRKNIGFVFQFFNLIPELTAKENILVTLMIDKTKPDKKHFDDLVASLGITDRLTHYPTQLSGGQQQRVAIARTLALSPDIMLFDEPMSALDAAMRVSLRKEIKEIQKKSGITMIYITHDQEEAFAMSDRIMVMNEGTIMQIGTPGEVYHHPANQYVEEFVTRQIEEKLTSLHESVDGKMG